MSMNDMGFNPLTRLPDMDMRLLPVDILEMEDGEDDLAVPAGVEAAEEAEL